jgi:flagellar basal body-associated protein FliL
MAHEPGNKKSGDRGHALVIVLPMVVVAAVGAWFWMHRGEDAIAQASGETRIASTLHLDSFVLNLADADQRSYLRVGIDLGLSRELKRDEPAPIAQVRDAILGVLAEGKVDELMTPAGKTKLKGSLLRALQERVPQLGVEEVYFTEFLIQR